MNDQLKKKIEQLINSSKVFLFMKGTPDEPQCGFSWKVVETLKGLGIKFDSFDILSDEEIRQAVKEYSNWPTYPQLYVSGKLIGGCDIVLEMAESGELKELVA
ncbi:Grx4 family monothiol glutaredoxin [Candidatus Woesearchaeota archaeon]|nr:Grx4 family monothiol glutaredoxin [Candidatus Woesearchaeota archaeon]